MADKVKKDGIFRRIVNFFKATKSEFKKVTWPTGKELMKTTVSVIIFIAIFAVIVYGIDTGLGAVFRLIVTCC